MSEEPLHVRFVNHDFDWLIVLPVKAPAYVVLPTASNRMTVREMWTMFKP
jgi:hypothetical protein